jgi:RNA polymerase sigma factor (TIGR02999 family)
MSVPPDESNPALAAPAELTAAFAALGGAGEPDAAALDQIYSELLKIARAELGRHRRGNTLDTRGLVHEAYFKLFGGAARDFANRKHFYATAAQAMRQVVIDYARARLAERRGGGAEHIALEALEGQPLPVDAQAEQLVQVDAALSKLAALDPRLVQVVELRFFSGLEVEEIAELLGVSSATIKRDTRAARAFLANELAG